ncbi:MAG: hypothetical protein LC687_06340, partial [Actinobacteria bacterium]|nr:hypothetical protein [Actinomycetota bacterium]
MYLEGVESAENIVYEQKRSLEGSSYLRTVALSGGRTLTLGTVSSSGSIMGLWYKKDVDDIKALELANAAVTLDYHGTTFTVKVVDTSNFEQFLHTEPVSDCKLYTGTITMIEV